jgi:hypothetical protein
MLRESLQVSSGDGRVTPGGGDAGLNRVRYRYRLLLHVFALEHAGWYGTLAREGEAGSL